MEPIIYIMSVTFAVITSIIVQQTFGRAFGYRSGVIITLITVIIVGTATWFFAYEKMYPSSPTPMPIMQDESDVKPQAQVQPEMPKSTAETGLSELIWKLVIAIWITGICVALYLHVKYKKKVIKHGKMDTNRTGRK